MPDSTFKKFNCHMHIQDVQCNDDAQPNVQKNNTIEITG